MWFEELSRKSEVVAGQRFAYNSFLLFFIAKVAKTYFKNNTEGPNKD